MELVARSPSCFSSRYVLKVDGSPVGEFTGRWFSEDIDVRMINGRRYHLKKTSWLKSQFQLNDIDGADLATAYRTGMLSSAWGLELSGGSARLESAGWFNTGFVLKRAGQRIATVDRVGLCEGGWCVTGESSVSESDLLLVGLIYHTILERRRSETSD